MRARSAVLTGARQPLLIRSRLCDYVLSDPHIWHVATASGGVWKTTNGGLNFTPIFDNYGSYTTCCILVDPRNSNVIWLGTGKNTISAAQWRAMAFSRAPTVAGDSSLGNPTKAISRETKIAMLFRGFACQTPWLPRADADSFNRSASHAVPNNTMHSVDVSLEPPHHIELNREQRDITRHLQCCDAVAARVENHP